MRVASVLTCAALACAGVAVATHVATAGEEGGAAAAASGVAFETGSPPLQTVLAKSKESGKPAFLNFKTSRCSWCRRLESEVFSKPAVGELMRNFVNADYDAEQGEGRRLAEQYHVQGFPTMVVVQADGAEVDRIEGFRAPEEFTKEITRIRDGEGTIPALRRRAAENPTDPTISLQLARKLTVAAPQDAETTLETMLQKACPSDREVQADAWISLARAARNANDAERARLASERVLQEFPDTPYAAEALQVSLPSDDPDKALAYLGKVTKDTKNTGVKAYAYAVVAEVHLQAAARALKLRAEAVGDDPQALNEVAWLCFERKLNLRPAVRWARRAVDLSKRDPAVLDTLANLLFVTGHLDEALRIEQEAVEHASSEAVKAEFGETLARFQAVETFRKSHATSEVAGFEDDASEDDDAPATASGSPSAPKHETAPGPTPR